MSSETLRQDVIDELEWEPSIDAAAVGVAVQEGVVTLTGHVPTYEQKRLAEKAVKRVTGVEGVANDLEVRLPTSIMTDDTDLAQTAVRALDWSVNVPKEKVKVTVEKGWLTLEGEVDWQYQKRAAEKAVRSLAGVRGVSNFVKVAPFVNPGQVKEKIEGAFKRSAQIDADHVKVSATGGKVTLTGTVHSWSERAEAENAAWSAPGVLAVDNRLQVAAHVPVF